MKKVIILSILIAISLSTFSQKEVRKQLRDGNKEYKQEKFTESEISYRKALEANAQSVDAAYNLGNALYKQGKYPEALQQFQAVTMSEKDTKKLAATFHNIGNIFMNQQDYAKSITAYKQSLRNNPSDNETRYNLALAQKLLEEQQQNQDQDQNQDKDKDKKEQEKQEQEKKEQEQKEQQQEQQNDKEDKTQQEQQQNEQMSQDKAQQILDALLQDEKNTQEKVQEAQMKQMKSRKKEKEW